MTVRNRYLEAFKEDFNLISLASAVAVAAATLNPLVLLPALVLEAAYLIFVPDLKWYVKRLAKLNDADIEKRREKLKGQILPTLRPILQQRFTRLEEVRQQIGTIARDEETLFREVLRKLDYLLDKFLQFAGKEVQFRTYLASILAESRGELPVSAAPQTPPNPQSKTQSKQPRRGPWLDDLFADSPTNSPANLPQNGPASSGTTGRRARSHAGNSPVGTNSAPGAGGKPPQSTSTHDDGSERWVQEAVAEVQQSYARDLQDLGALLRDETDEGMRAVLEKRIEVLNRRREFVGKIGRILLNLTHQLELLEDTFGLISDEIRARPPEQVLADIEDVVTQTNTMTQVLEELAPYEQSLARLIN